jgi:hypothetical protein
LHDINNPATFNIHHEYGKIQEEGVGNRKSKIQQIDDFEYDYVRQFRVQADGAGLMRFLYYLLRTSL